MAKTNRFQVVFRVFTKRRESSKSTRSRAGPPTLPPELILYTLQTLAAVENAAQPKTHSAAYISDSPFQSLDYRPLASACLVSKTWYLVGCTVLYNYPHLRNLQDLKIFLSTVEGSPRLAELVKGLTVLDQCLIPSRPRLIPWNSIVPRRKRTPQHRKDQDRTITKVDRILKTCPNLTGLGIEIWPGWDMPEPVIDTSNGPWVTTRTRFLSIILRNTFDLAFTHFAFPFLEVLCLVTTCINNDVELHPLPRVHTLRVYQQMVNSQRSNLDSATIHRLFPNLRNLELFGKDLIFPGKNIEVSPQILHLDRQCFVVGEGTSAFVKWREYLSTVKSRELVIGVLHQRNKTLDNWRFPQRVESLTLILKLVSTESADNSASPSIWPMLRLVEALHYNAPYLRASSLRRLTIWIERRKEWECGLPEEYEKVSGVIAAFCELHGIQLDIREVCECICFLPLLVLSDMNSHHSPIRLDSHFVSWQHVGEWTWTQKACFTIEV